MATTHNFLENFLGVFRTIIKTATAAANNLNNSPFAYRIGLPVVIRHVYFNRRSVYAKKETQSMRSNDSSLYNKHGLSSVDISVRVQ